ncbi:c-type cytochrome [Massilia arenae]|uniref:C-type cytochrome n=1 Tax=Massilia arenae TaxID=2603288 RepID=A0A5C7FSD3_9BURK|nr:c-type cytochrome [Massilia arenae]TXF98982.1 c-type cytochrome [Massilia arenae]
MRTAPTLQAFLLLLALAGCGRTDTAAVGQVSEAASPARIEAGRKLFARCAGCHELGPKAGHIFGPHLNGVLGREAGSVPGYAYSPALKASTLVWDEANLTAFIRDSERVIPGNKMRFMSFLSDRQAGDIVAYLATQGGTQAGQGQPRP